MWEFPKLGQWMVQQDWGGGGDHVEQQLLNNSLNHKHWGDLLKYDGWSPTSISCKSPGEACPRETADWGPDPEPRMSPRPKPAGPGRLFLCNWRGLIVLERLISILRQQNQRSNVSFCLLPAYLRFTATGFVTKQWKWGVGRSRSEVKWWILVCLWSLTRSQIKRYLWVGGWHGKGDFLRMLH